MKNPAYTLTELAKHLDAVPSGDMDCSVHSIASLQLATEGQVSFLNNPQYRKYLGSTKASIVVVTPDNAPYCPTNKLIMNDPYLGFARLTALFDNRPADPEGIHLTAVIGDGCDIDSTVVIGAQVVIGNQVVIERGAVIGPGVVIGDGCHIGADTRLCANVTLYYGVKIGEACLIHSGTVIGSDGFGLVKVEGHWQKIAQLGAVQVGDDVEIGANVTIDRGAMEDTIIEEGVKIDNLVQIAHNCRVGAHSAIAGCSGLAGSSQIGKHCALGGGVGIAGHLSIADNVTVTAMSLVSHTLHESGVYSSGTGIEPNKTWRRNAARFRRLDKLAKQVQRLLNVSDGSRS